MLYNEPCMLKEWAVGSLASVEEWEAGGEEASEEALGEEGEVGREAGWGSTPTWAGEEAGSRAVSCC